MYDESVKGYWHVYSDGKKADIPFLSDADKIYAMNSVAICAYASGMEVLCLEVNDTHLHTVLHGDNPQDFKSKLKRRITVLERRKEESSMGTFFLACDGIATREELLGKIVYTFRNCLDFFKGVPWDYRWGVGNLYFASRKQEGTLLDEITFRERYRLLECRLNLPREWRISVLERFGKPYRASSTNTALALVCWRVGLKPPFMRKSPRKDLPLPHQQLVSTFCSVTL